MLSLNEPQIVKKISEIWEHRKQRKTDKVTSLFNQLYRSNFHNLGNRPSEFIPLLQQKLNPQTAIDFLALYAYVRRIRDKDKDAKIIIEYTKKYFSDQDLTKSFKFLYEFATQKYFDGDYLNSYEFSLSAREAATDASDKLMASFLIINNQDCIGLDYSENFKQFEKELELLGFPEKEKFYDHSNFYKIRSYFMQANFSFLFNAPTKYLSSQRVYNQTYYLCLAYQKICEPISNSLIFEILHNINLTIYKSFRINTILGELDFCISKDTSISEYIDRLYLWVWFWLRDPYKFHLTKIMKTYELLEEGNKLKLSFGEYNAFLNVLLWVGLFSRKNFQSILNQVPHLKKYCNTKEYHIYSYERLYIQYFYAFRDKDNKLKNKIKKEILKHRLYKNDQTYFSDILKYFENPSKMPTDFPFKILVENIGLLKLQNFEIGNVYIMPEINRVMYFKKNNLVLEEAEYLAKFLAFIKTNSWLTREIFINEVFRLYNYNYIIHNARVNNVLLRAKRILPQLEIKSKNNMIYINGDTNCINVINQPVYSRQFESLRLRIPKFATVKKISKKVNVKKRKKDNQFVSSRLYSRKEIEKFIGRSRSTVSRAIARWQRAGKVTKFGSYKNATYKLSKAVI